MLRAQDRLAAKFVQYRLRSPDFLDAGQGAWLGVAGLKRISAEFLRNTTIEESAWRDRARAVDFLDRECARIEALVEQSTAVTRHLRPWFESARAEAIVGADEVPLRYLLSASRVGIVIQPARLYDDAGSVDVIRAVDIQDEEIRPAASGFARISEQNHLRNIRSELHDGDVVVVRSGQAGMAAVVPAQLHGTNCVDVLILTPDDTMCTGEYLAELLNAAPTRQRVTEFSVGSIQGHMNLGALRALRVSPIARAEQDRAVAHATAFRAARRKLESKAAAIVRSLLAYRGSLIYEAVTGRLDLARASDQQLGERLHAAAEGRLDEVAA